MKEPAERGKSQIGSSPSHSFGKANRLAGLVVKASSSRAVDTGSIPTSTLGFLSCSSHTSDLKIDTPVATLPGAWRDRVSAGVGWPGVSIL